MNRSLLVLGLIAVSANLFAVEHNVGLSIFEYNKNTEIQFLL
ncbi:MAG: hypothetical protein U0T83_01870 [Bacteriovoracaceae bacterium]